MPVQHRRLFYSLSDPLKPFCTQLSHKPKETDKEIDKEINRIKQKIKQRISENAKTKEKNKEKINLNNPKFRKIKFKSKDINKTTINENERNKSKNTLINNYISQNQKPVKNNTHVILDSDNVKTPKTTDKDTVSDVDKKIFLYKKSVLGQHFSLCSKTIKTSHSPNYSSKGIF